MPNQKIETSEIEKDTIGDVNGKPHTWSKKNAAFSGGEY